MELKKYPLPYQQRHTVIGKDAENIYIFPDNIKRASGSTALPEGSEDYKKRFPNIKRFRRPITKPQIVRGYKNAFPITIKNGSYMFEDKDFDEAKKYIDEDFEYIKQACIERKPKCIYFPPEGLYGNDCINTFASSGFKIISYILQKEKELLDL